MRPLNRPMFRYGGPIKEGIMSGMQDRPGYKKAGFVGGLISGSGTVDFLYTAASGDETANFFADVLTAEDPADAQFELFLDTSGTKKVSFNGIVTGSSLSSSVGDLSTVSISFVTSGAITNAA